MATNRKIKKGDRVFFLPQWQDAGDELVVFLAIEDEVEGMDRIKVSPQLPNFAPELMPWNYVGLRMIDRGRKS